MNWLWITLAVIGGLFAVAMIWWRIADPSGYAESMRQAEENAARAKAAKAANTRNWKSRN
jgi:hypothetical protein